MRHYSLFLETGITYDSIQYISAYFLVRLKIKSPSTRVTEDGGHLFQFYGEIRDA